MFFTRWNRITNEIDLVVVSTAIEDTCFEVQKAKQLNIPIIKRSELLALIAKSKKTIAVGGTSGKSTTTAMLFDILEHAGLQPGIISGAGLVSIIKEGKIGNAKTGKGEWLVIEADESDGSIVQYEPEIGLLLNVDKDHKEIDVLMEIFTTFKNNTKEFIYSKSIKFTWQNNFRKICSMIFQLMKILMQDLLQQILNNMDLTISFEINGVDFSLNQVGKHNMENALAATCSSQSNWC